MTDDLRRHYAEALASTNTLDATDLEFTLDQVMAIRDGELEQLKDDALMIVADAAHERDAWRTRAMQAEAARGLLAALLHRYQWPAASRTKRAYRQRRR